MSQNLKTMLIRNVVIIISVWEAKNRNLGDVHSTLDIVTEHCRNRSSIVSTGILLHCVSDIFHNWIRAALLLGKNCSKCNVSGVNRSSVGPCPSVSLLVQCETYLMKLSNFSILFLMTLLKLL